MEKIPRWLFHILEMSMDNIDNLHNLLQNLHPKIKFPWTTTLKNYHFLDILIKKTI